MVIETDITVLQRVVERMWREILKQHLEPCFLLLLEERHNQGSQTAEEQQAQEQARTVEGLQVFCPFGISTTPGEYQARMAIKILQDYYLNGAIVLMTLSFMQQAQWRVSEQLWIKSYLGWQLLMSG